jgi:hypothetical protein
MCGIGAADDWNVTWTTVSESIIDKEYIIEVQNLQTTKRDVNISSFFDETNFNINKLHSVEFYEWKLLPYNYTIKHYDYINHSERNATNETWHNWTESVHNWTETVESEKLEWKACRSQLFPPTAHSVRDDYGLMNIPKLGSKDTGDGTYNGTKRFLLKFRTPIIKTVDGFGSNGKVAVLLDDVEYHPYWNSSWSNRQTITLTGGSSGAQTNYQLLLNITYDSDMQADFDDLRFANATHQIDAWLESNTTDYALIEVEFPSTPANGVNQTYYVYYGNAEAASDWDIGATFIFGDDFVNADKWTISDTNAINVESGVMRVKAVSGGKNAYVTSKPTLGDNFVMEYDYKPTAGYTHYGAISVGLTEQTAYDGGDNGIFHWHYGGASSGTQNVKLLSVASGSYYDGTSITPYTTNELYKFQYTKVGASVTCKIWDNSHSESSPNTNDVLTCRDSYEYNYIDIFTRSGYTQPATDVDNLRFRKHVSGPPTSTFGSEQIASDSILYNATQPYNHTISSDALILINRSATGSTDTNWTAAAASSDSFLILTGYDKTADTVGEFTLSGGDLDWLAVTNLSGSTKYGMKTGGSIGETQTTNAAGEANFTTDISAGSYEIVKVGYVPPDPTSLANTTGNFWVNHTWSVGSGNITNSYNVSQNGTWHNTTTTPHFNATSVGAHGYSDITIYAFNSSESGTLSAGSITQNTTVPNNAITITNTSDATPTTGDTVYVDYDATDADSDAPTFSCNRTDLFADFSTSTGKGNWTTTTAGTYYIDFGVADGYGSTSNYTMTVTVSDPPISPPNIQDGVFGMLNSSIPDNSTLLSYKNNNIVTVESTLNWDTITSGVWSTYKASLQYCYDNNRRSGLRMSFGDDYTSGTYITNVKTNITTYLPDLTSDPYQTTVQFIAINFTNTSASDADKTTFANSIAQNISEQTDHKLKIVVVESLSGLDSTYVEVSPIIYKVLTTKSNWIDFEATTLRGNETKSRIYSGNETFILDLSTHNTNIFSKMRNSHNTSDQYSETHSVKVVGGDIILYNNASSAANITVASAASGLYWDIHNDTMLNNSGGGTIGFWVDAESFTYLVKEASFEKIVYQTNNSSLLWASPTTAETIRSYHNGSMTDSYLWGGDNTDLKVEVWDPTYVKTNLHMIHYEWINASYVSNYTDYEYIIIADYNTNEISNTINKTNNTYGYISVSDYTDTGAWVTGKKSDVDNWVDNYSVNIFLDGIDFAVGGANFSARMKEVSDYIKDTKGKNLIMNTYTAYNEFATYGDAVMKESAFARWDGAVGAPTYSYEDMSIEKDRADFYSSHNITVLGMSFGALEDYDKMAYCAAAFSVLYGFDGENRWRYGQPNFQAQREQNIYDFGTMLETSYTETSATDWNRLYEHGRVHIDPAAHTWYIDDDRAVNNISIDFTFYSGGAGAGDRNVYVYANGNTTQHIIPYYPGTDPVGSWTERSAYLDTTEHVTHGHYDIYYYTRPDSGGWNFMGKHESSTIQAGRHSWYDTTTENLPDTYDTQTWNTLARDINWMVNITVNYTTSEYIDELTDRITQSTASTATNYTTMVVGTRDTEIPVWAGVVSLTAYSGAKTYAKDTGGSWVEIGVDDVTNASSSSTSWNYTTVDSEQWGAVRQHISGNTYNYRYLLPHTSTQEILTASSLPAPVITLLSQNPSTIFQNTTGYMNISYGISHDSAGLNNTSVSFIFRNYDHTLNDANHSIRPPANDKCEMWNFDGQIMRAANRNETLNFENNDTITGGDIFTWSGLDENNTHITIVPVNSTYTIVHINGTIHDLAMEQMWYLDRTDMVEAPKTQLAIHKTQDVLIKFWNAEIFKGNYDFIGMGYTDTSLESAPAAHPSDANPVSFYYLNSSYDPLGGVDPLDSAVFMGSLNATQWIDHVYSPGPNASYVRGAINNTLLNSVINTTEISYLYFKSNTPSSKPFYVNITDSSTNTNRTFGQTDVLWIGDAAPYTAHPYTPNVWFAFVYDNTSFDHKLYVADNNGKWGNGTLQSTNIGVGLFPPTKPSISHFHFNGSDDYNINKTYADTIEVYIGVGTDPDGGTVTHNLTLHYKNQTLVAIINNTFTDADIIGNGVYAEIPFNTTPYYSETEEYTLKVVATDDEGETSESWSCCNFTLGTHQISNLHTTTLVYNRIVWEWVNPDYYDIIMVYLDNVWKQNTTGTYYSASSLSQQTAYSIKLITVYAGVESDPATDTQVTPAEQGGSSGGGGDTTPAPTATATPTPTITPPPDEIVTENVSIAIEPLPEITKITVINETILATVWHLNLDKHWIYMPDHANIIACTAIPPYACRYYGDKKKFEIVIDGESPDPVFTADQWVTFITQDGERISQRIRTKVYNPMFYLTFTPTSASVTGVMRYFVHGDENIMDGVRVWWLGLLGMGLIAWAWRRKK